MKRKTLKLLNRASACLPMVMAAAHPHADALKPAAHGEQEAGAWTFHHENVLGTSLEVKVRAGSLGTAQRAESAALAEIDRLDRVLSAWRTDSEFSRWSKTSFQPVKISPELFDVLAGFDYWRVKTGSALDPSAEAALRLWRNALVESRTPTSQEIAATVEAIAQPHWQLNTANRTATRTSDVPLALASFAKSYIASSAADAALAAGASGIMLNAGGDVVVRGDMRQMVDIADPSAPADNDLPLDRVMVQDRAVATSGSYRRGIQIASSLPAVGHSPAKRPQFSHIVDPRTAMPTNHVLSATVISRDVEAAAALATAFCVLSTADSARLAARSPGIEYLLVTQDGRQIHSTGWSAYQTPGLRNAAFAAPSTPTKASAAAGAWNPVFQLSLSIELPRIEDARYRRPYVAVWVEDADHFPVRTLALWFNKNRWLPDLKQWYRDDQIRNLAEGTDVSRTISSATRPPGRYDLVWDGKDNEGALVKAGKYSIVVEAAREHGSYSIARHEMDFNGKPHQTILPASAELGTITLDYHKR